MIFCLIKLSNPFLKQVNDLQEEFQVYKEKMELENQEKQNEIERLMRIINLYENSGIYFVHFFLSINWLNICR